MMLEGTVTNVAAFGAFVDVGVHQDGLVHVSQMADRFVKDPHEVAKAGQVVRVRVVEVDVPRKRIGLSMRRDGGGKPTEPEASKPQGQAARKHGQRKDKAQPDQNGAIGAALRNAMRKQ
jgi:uncharacterized protein